MPKYPGYKKRVVDLGLLTLNFLLFPFDNPLISIWSKTSPTIEGGYPQCFSVANFYCVDLFSLMVNDMCVCVFSNITFGYTHPSIKSFILSALEGWLSWLEHHTIHQNISV